MNVNVRVPEPFSPLLDPKVRRIVEESGRSSGKSTTNEMVAVVKMMSERPIFAW